MNYFFAAILLAFGIFAGCQNANPPQKEKPIVLVTMAPYAHFVKEIAQDLVQVETLIPEGANPHLYEAPPLAVEKHQTADLWLYLGENFDKKMVQFLKERGSQIQTLNLTEGIALLHEKGHACSCEHAQEEHDLHLWMSPRVVKAQVEKIAEKLIALLPEKQELLMENKKRLINKLQALDEKLVNRLQEKQGHTLLVSHPAFGYFCRDYALEQLSIEVAGKEPKPSDLAHILSHAKELAIPFILIEPQHSKKGADAIGQVLHIPTKEINPYAEDYFGTLDQLSLLIAHE